MLLSPYFCVAFGFRCKVSIVSNCVLLFYCTPSKRMLSGVYWNHPVCPSIRVSVFVQNTSFCQSAAVDIKSYLVAALVVVLFHSLLGGLYIFYSDQVGIFFFFISKPFSGTEFSCIKTLSLTSFIYRLLFLDLSLAHSLIYILRPSRIQGSCR